MKIIISQRGKKLLVEFYSDARQWRGRSPDLSVGVDRAEDFLACIDKFLKKSDNAVKAINKAVLKFVGTGILTERIVRAIMKGLIF